MERRTKDEIAEDKEFTCSQKGCKKKVEEIYEFTSYHQAAVLRGFTDGGFCEECFKKKEKELFY